MLTLHCFRGLVRGFFCCLLCSLATAQEKADEPITRAEAALKEKKWADAVVILQSLTATEPGRWEYHRSLGDALLGLGKYEGAIRAYETGVSLVQKEPPAPAPGRSAEELKQAAARMLVSKGNACIKLRKPDEAIAAYRQAAQSDPNPGLAWFNLAATCYNLGRMNDAIEYCDKTIATDPARADVYFIKGSALMGTATWDQRGKLIAPPGMIESLQKYLELKPDGPHAADARAILEAAGVCTTPAKP
jgi:tetratricopeptide (TPR) repeat protein